MQFQDYYTLLGVPRNADEKEIRRAYREKARKHHPDVNKDQDAEERFKAVNEAYQVLSDPEKRAKYDRFGADWERYQAAPDAGAGMGDFAQWFTGQQAGNQNVRYEYRSNGGEGFSDFFETLFGSAPSRGGRRRRAPRRGEDHEHAIEVPLLEAFTGTTRTFEMQIPETCANCGGSGISRGRICDACDGSGSVPKKSRIEVTIPAGIRDGQRIRVAGKGSPGTDGGPPGDVYLRVRIKPDATFTLDGTDLRTEIDVPLYTAILGDEVVVRTPSGRVALTIPPETQNGRVFRLRRQGWPLSTGSTERGDLLARVNITLPTRLSDTEQDLFERLREERETARTSTPA
jgi:molecular chaperone DnaJ